MWYSRDIGPTVEVVAAAGGVLGSVTSGKATVGTTTLTKNRNGSTG